MIADAYRRLRIYGNVPQLPVPVFCIPIVGKTSQCRRRRSLHVDEHVSSGIFYGAPCTVQGRIYTRRVCSPLSPLILSLSLFFSLCLFAYRTMQPHRDDDYRYYSRAALYTSSVVRPLFDGDVCVGRATQNSEAEIQICDNVKRGIKSSRLRSARPNLRFPGSFSFDHINRIKARESFIRHSELRKHPSCIIIKIAICVF